MQIPRINPGHEALNSEGRSSLGKTIRVKNTEVLFGSLFKASTLSIVFVLV